MKKRIFCMALALVLTLALAAPVFAEGEAAAPAPEYRLVSITQGEETYTFTYGQGGWLPTEVTGSEGEAVLTAAYDDAGRVVSQEDQDGTVTYEYNENGDVLVSSIHFNEMHSADGTTTTWDSNTTNTYDENGNCIHAETASGYGGELSTTISEYTRDDAGNLLREEDTYGDGATRTTEYTYDAAGNLLRVEGHGVGAIDFAYEYTYDEAGNRLSETYYSVGEKYSETTYVYDDEGRVAQEDYTSDYDSQSTKYIHTPLLTFTLEESSYSESEVNYYLYNWEGAKIFQSGMSYTGGPQFTYDDNGYVTQIDFDDGAIVFTYEPVT